MIEESWRPPTAAELTFVEGWASEWNATRTRRATVANNLVVRGSCSCGSCPSFSAKPILIDAAIGGVAPDARPVLLPGGDWGIVLDASGKPVASATLRALGGDAIDFDIATFDEPVRSLDGCTYDFICDTAWP